MKVTQSGSPRRNTKTTRAAAIVNVYLRSLIHDEPADVLVDMLTELQQHCQQQGWNFKHALNRSYEEVKVMGGPSCN